MNDVHRRLAGIAQFDGDVVVVIHGYPRVQVADRLMIIDRICGQQREAGAATLGRGGHLQRRGVAAGKRVVVDMRIERRVHRAAAGHLQRTQLKRLPVIVIVIVGDRAGRGRAGQRCTVRVAEREGHRESLGFLGVLVVHDRHGDALHGGAGRERQRAAYRFVVRGGRGGLVRGRVPYRDRASAGGFQLNLEAHRAITFIQARVVDAQSRRRVVVLDRAGRGERSSAPGQGAFASLSVTVRNSSSSLNSSSCTTTSMVCAPVERAGKLSVPVDAA